MRKARRATFIFAFVAAFSGAAVALSCGIDVVGGPDESPKPVPEAGQDSAASLPDTGGSEDTGTKPDVEVEASARCPGSPEAGTMIEAPLPDGGTFCIDQNEVTNASYDLFVAATDGGISANAFDGGPCLAYPLPFTRKTIGSTNPAFPVDYVTWCDAFAYCRWAGKRLCGGLAADRDASTGEWYSACSAGGTKVWPYGDAASTSACNTAPSISTKAVRSAAGCVGGYPGLYDMSGNAGEWIDSCAAGLCAYAGGFYGTAPVDAKCASNVEGSGVTQYYSGVGIRCCAATK